MLAKVHIHLSLCILAVLYLDFFLNAIVYTRKLLEYNVPPQYIFLRVQSIFIFGAPDYTLQDME
jgi:hypothetical protein